MIKKLLLSSVLAASAVASQAQAHTVALGWDVLSNGDVTFYDAHWHGEIIAPAGSLFIDGVEYAFTGIENNVNSRSGLEGGLINSTYYNWTAGTGTLAVNTIPTSEGFRSYNDWLTVTVSGLSAGSHTFSTTNIALTQWTLDNNQSSVEVIIPDVQAVPVPAAAALFAPALFGFMALRRKSKNNA